MGLPVADYWKELWEKWNIRAIISLSLALQTFLILVAPFRKRTSSNWIIMLLWSAYLLADWAANFAIGLISSSQSPKPGRHHSNPDLLAFWAPFLLVHLGGPDTITAFALEDNELWLRHFLGLIFQTLAVIYVFFQSLSFNELSIPTAIMFLVGLIKYLERTRALYLASLNSFRNSMLKELDPSQNYAKLMDVYFSKKDANLPAQIVMIDKLNWQKSADKKDLTGKLKRIDIVHYAHMYYETFKGIIVDMIFSFHKRNQSREFFLAREPEDAFAVVEVELNFFYEALYTKASVVYTVVGCVFRVLSFVLVIVSFSLFYTIDKKGLNRFDVRITYTLLIGAILLDTIAFVMLFFSDRTAIAMKKFEKIGRKLQEKSPEEGVGGAQEKSPEKGVGGADACWFRRIVNRRWSESMSAYNLIYYCIHPRQVLKEEFAGYLGLNNFLDGFKYVKKNPFTDHLRDHIFTELKSKSDKAQDLQKVREICSSKGHQVLKDEKCEDLLLYVNELEYDQIVLLWHVATELCYHRPENLYLTNPERKCRDFAKVLSDYMLYLLVMQPTLMSKVAGIGQIRFRDTCSEAKKILKHQQQRRRRQKVHLFQLIRYVFASFFKYACLALAFVLFPIILVYASFVVVCYLIFQVEIWPCSWAMILFRRWRGKERREREEQEAACRRIFNIKAEVKPMTEKDDPSKSVLLDACVLAKELEKLGKEKKWKVMSKVWVDLMCYAASHCRADAHAAMLNKGGELITIVWLLMANLGLGDQFQINEGTGRATLVVRK